MFDTINDATGFANGTHFTTADEVREYFTPENMRSMFGDDAIVDDEKLTAWAEMAIANRWHMA